ncbi:efflux transporter outer membrane subunit [Psychrobacter cryohalolentis]|uniref:RND efflux system, outer membrane lipoprotein, NodT n=1 Tax=Psychrobacter cryohalolentis (strain ATCC BAA-1226 / DSM 17306 / VKM B-2378 / K5) TaxID=335284 RepID=Q1Q9W7_PSYCK|nr:efflux transporter outer membrane subunit [Psychrobacter cryohalolentis]ABE75536.1 RND efflux system, outer membrane lipoprotein, NodT [Psychrobacter cryohalolentis K5]ASE25726.1 transporter [Psychrobacter cryohalolentis]
MSLRYFVTPNSVTKAVSLTARVRQNSGRLIGLTALAMSMAACNTIPKADTRPVLAVPNIPIEQTYGAFDKETVSSAEQASLASQRWQNFYSDERLKGLIALGLENNKDFESARLAIEKARAQYQITDINDLPRIDGNAGYSRTRQRGQTGDNYNVNLGLANYELDFWGKIASLKDQALQNFLSTTAAKDATQISLISNIAQSYANLSYSLAQLQLAEATVESREKSLFIASKRFEAGIDPKLPSLQSSASLENARLAVLRAQSSILKSRNALQFLVGGPIPTNLIPTPAVSNITSQQVFSAGLPSELLRYRPDVLQAEYNLKAAGANIEVARASYYPSISLASNIGLSSGSLNDLFKSGSVGWSFGPSVSVPIFDAGRLDANYDVAQIERKQTLAGYERSIQTAFREVSDVLATRATLGEQLEGQYRLQDNFEQTYQIADARFKAGISNYLDVLDAQRSLFSTQQGILDLELQKIISQVELYQVLGGGANLDVPTVIPVPHHRNLVQVVNAAANSNKAKATDAIDAASSARVVSAQEALAIKQAQPVEKSTFKPTAVVDVNNDGKTDAALGVITEETISKETRIKEVSVEQVPVTQIIEP